MSNANFFQKLTPRLIFGVIFLTSSVALAYALYAQFFQNAAPCVLCVVQRLIYASAALVALIAFFLKNRLIKLIFAIVLTAITIFGIKTSYHHYYLQHLDPSTTVPSCGMPLNIMFKNMPFTNFIQTVLSGSAECTVVNWQIFGISGVTISLSGFWILTLLSLIALIKLLSRR